MLLLLEPCYLGYYDPQWPLFRQRPEGWYREVLENGVEGCRDFGRYLGRRYGSADNILWVMAGDRDPGEARAHVTAMAEGIVEAGPGQRLFTAHVHPDHRPMEEFAGDAWLTVNATYSYEIVHKNLLEEYRRSPVRPNFLFESSYEGMHEASERQIRRQGWWPMVRGAFGQVMGNDPLFWFGPGWRSQLDSPGARSMTIWRDFWAALPWWRLVPDEPSRLVLGWLGEQNGLERVTAARTPECDLAVVYLAASRPIEVDLGVMKGPLVEASWFDPATGTVIDAGRHASEGIIEVDAPFNLDAALLLRTVSG